MAQVLLTLEDSEQRRRYLNARATLEALLALGALPVINENDTVATAEIRYGDNDRLAARVAQMTGADCLVLLSDVEGSVTADPNRDPHARVHRHGARDHTARSRPWPAARRSGRRLGRHGDQDPRGARSPWPPAATCASPPGSPRIRCGASRRARAAPGSCRRRPRPRPASSGSPARLRPAGALTIDAGALKALQQGKSLLPAGVVAHARPLRARRYRERASAPTGSEIARGISAYSDADAARIMGREVSRDREPARLSRPRRDDPPRRSGDPAHRAAHGRAVSRGGMP